MKRCKHECWDQKWATINRTQSIEVSRICAECRATLSLGPANDEPADVQVEMRAAEIVGVGFGPMTIDERRGYQSHCLQTFCPGVLEVAGWLACEMNHSDGLRKERDATAWSWSISRPIAEQLAETARDDADAATAWRDWAKDNMISHEEYEASRDAEPDCRDEDYGPNPIGEHIGDDTAPSCRLGAKDPNEDAMRDPAVTAHNAEAIAQRLVDKAYAQCETMRREAWKANAPVRAAARRIIESWPDDNTPTPQATDEVCACTGDALLSEKCEVVP